MSVFNSTAMVARFYSSASPVTTTASFKQRERWKHQASDFFIDQETRFLFFASDCLLYVLTRLLSNPTILQQKEPYVLYVM
jgi:hypothetical protein